ncbi:LysR family transcriptional regulator [Acidaminococcus sp. LBK-2]|uniref:LysR family transcriptional regulator n=1 Tax=Acidaminococcus sp. LBK-2 TaxID=3456956 RepID=UPI003FA44352
MKTAYDYIYTIYQEGSFTRAAEKLFITQPALSIALRKIEARIGMPLFERNRRPVQLTPAGELYLKTIKKMHGLENDLDREVQELRDFQTGTLTLGGSHYLLSYQIPDLLTAYVQKYPKIHLQLIEEASDTLLTLLEKDELDLTFSCDSVVIRKHTRHYPAFQDQILLAVPRSADLAEDVKNYALSVQDIGAGCSRKTETPTVSITQFQNLPFILLTPGNNLYKRCQALFQKAGFMPHIKLMLSQLATAQRLAEHGLAATFVSDAMVGPTSQDLLFFKIAEADFTRSFHALLPDKEFTPYSVRAFIQLLKP